MTNNLIKCPDCGKEVSKKAVSCPSCGHAFKTQGGINLKDPIHFIGVILVIIMILGVIFFILQST